MHKNIMVSYDGSRESLRALGEAKQMLASNPLMSLHIVQVSTDVDLEAAANMSWYGMGMSTGDYRPIEAEALMRFRDQMREKRLAALHEELDDHLTDVGNEVEFAVIEQTATIAEALLDYAREHEVDLIVMGCRGLGAIRGVLGSVSYAVLRMSETSVLIAK